MIPVNERGQHDLRQWQLSRNVDCPQCLNCASPKQSSNVIHHQYVPFHDTYQSYNGMTQQICQVIYVHHPYIQGINIQVILIVVPWIPLLDSRLQIGQ